MRTGSLQQHKPPPCRSQHCCTSCRRRESRPGLSLQSRQSGFNHLPSPFRGRSREQHKESFFVQRKKLRKHYCTDCRKTEAGHWIPFSRSQRQPPTAVQLGTKTCHQAARRRRGRAGREEPREAGFNIIGRSASLESPRQNSPRRKGEEPSRTDDIQTPPSYLSR